MPSLQREFDLLLQQSKTGRCAPERRYEFRIQRKALNGILSGRVKFYSARAADGNRIRISDGISAWAHEFQLKLVNNAGTFE